MKRIIVLSLVVVMILVGIGIVRTEFGAMLESFEDVEF